MRRFRVRGLSEVPSVQFSHSVVPSSLQLRGLQHAMRPCPSPTHETCSNSYPLIRWCFPTILSSVFLFSSCLPSFPASGSFPVSQFFESGGQRIGFSFSIGPSNEYSGLISFRIEWLDLLAVQEILKGLLQYHSSKASILGTQLSLWSNSQIHTWLLEKPQLWLDGPFSAK